MVKPIHLGISAKEAYTKYSLKTDKPNNNMTDKMIDAINNKQNITPFLYNDLEYAIFDDFPQLQEIKKAYPNAVMSGSGSTYFVLESCEKSLLDKDYLFINNLKFIEDGVSFLTL